VSGTLKGSRLPDQKKVGSTVGTIGILLEWGRFRERSDHQIQGNPIKFNHQIPSNPIERIIKSHRTQPSNPIKSHQIPSNPIKSHPPQSNSIKSNQIHQRAGAIPSWFWAGAIRFIYAAMTADTRPAGVPSGFMGDSICSHQWSNII
jgi:hypothetical protein